MIPKTAGRRPLAVIFQTVFLDLLGFGLVLPLLPLYALRFGATPVMVTALSSSYSLMQFLFVPVWGRLSDRIGRRPVLLVSIAGAAIAYAAMGLTGSLAGLFAARIFSGIAGANLSAAQAAIADVTAPEERARGMGLVGAAFGLGFVLGPMVGGTLSSLPPSWFPAAMHPHIAGFPFFAASLLASVNFVLAYRWLPETCRSRESATAEAIRPAFTGHALARAIRRPELGWLIAIAFATTVAFAQMESTFVLWGERTLGMRGRDAGLVFAYIGVLLVVVQGLLVGRLARRFGERRLVVTGTAAMAAALLLTPLCRAYAPLLAVLAVLAAGSSIAGPAMQALISRAASAEDQGGVLGLTQSLSSLARVVGPLGAGALFQTAGPSAPWLCGGLLMGVTSAASAAVLMGAWGAGLSRSRSQTSSPPGPEGNGGPRSGS